MSLKFSPHPGPRERHLRRKHANPLFTVEQRDISEQQLQHAREQDEIELNHFLRYFRDLVQEAIDLKPDSDSEVVLGIKERLDKCYAHCCALPGDQSAIKDATNKLIEVIMKAVRQGAANDPVAVGKLEEEDIARRMHNELHAFSIVADLLLPDSPIASDELVPSLLSEPETALSAALQLFDADQLSRIYADAKALLGLQTQPGEHLSHAEVNLKLIEKALSEARTDLPLSS